MRRASTATTSALFRIASQQAACLCKAPLIRFMLVHVRLILVSGMSKPELVSKLVSTNRSALEGDQKEAVSINQCLNAFKRVHP